VSAPAEHRIRWFFYVDGVRYPHSASLRGRVLGWDATCSCGWDSRTGGAIKASVRRDVDWHKCQAGIATGTYGPGLGA